MKNLILTEDDCAPDALEAFEKQFKVKTGMSLQKFKTQAKRIDGEYDCSYVYDKYTLTCSADSPYWELFEEDEKEIVIDVETTDLF